MLYVSDKIIEIGGIVIPGQVKSIEIIETATIDEAKDESGKLKAVQALGFEAGKVNVTVILEDMEGKNTLSQLMDIQRLFKAAGAQTPNLLPVINEDCAARGIGAVHIKSVTSSKVIEKSRREVVIECIAPEVVGIQVETIPGEVAKAVQEAGGAAVAAYQEAKAKAAAQSAVPKKNQSNTKSKTTKSTAKTPAKDAKATYDRRITAQKLADAKAKQIKDR